MSLLHHILQPRWNVYYFSNNLKSTDEEHQISAIHKLNGRPKKFHHSLTHSVLLGYPPVPATWPYFEQWASLPATCAVSPPTPPFLCASSCPGICFSCASSVDSSLGYASVWSPQCEQSIPKLFVLCPSLPVAALLVSRATPCIFVYLTKSAGCFSGSYYMSTWCLCLNPLVSRQVSEPYGSTTFTFHPENFILILIVSALDRQIGLNIANAALPFQYVTGCPLHYVPSYLQWFRVTYEFVHHLDPLPFNEHVNTAFGTDILWSSGLPLHLAP